LKVPYADRADIWSLGVCVLEIIDRKAFDVSSSFRSMFLTATEGRRDILGSSSASPELKDFATSMLTYEVSKRPSASELLSHPFLEKAYTRKHLQQALTTHG